ncbi:MAG: Gfo/Idh/MocA family oxidoreductase [Gemmatimonadota bacterium]
MVGFAVIGLGMGRSRARLIHQTQGARVAVVCDVVESLAREVGEELACPWTPHLDDALARPDVDVVQVMTPSGMHAEHGIRAARAGKHVITTKPMDVRSQACDQLIAAATAAGVRLGVDYQSRYVPTNFRVARAMREGLLGRPILGEVRFKWFRSQEYFQHGTGWRGTWAMDGGGSLANQGAHLLDLLLWFMGDPVRLYAETAVMNHRIETEDLGLVMLSFASGAKGTILGTTTFPESAYFGAEVHGALGGVRIEAALDGTAQYYGPGLAEKLAALPGPPVANIAEDVVSCLERGTDLMVDGREGRRTVALLEDIYRSAREGVVVECGRAGGAPPPGREKT